MEQLTKDSAAIRQLEEAIRMLFRNRDRVPIHTLAAASRQVLADLAGKQGITGLFDDLTYIRPERQEEWKRLLAQAENFFKHADRDPTATLSFAGSEPIYLMIDACILLERLGKHTHTSTLFMTWVAMRYPEFFDEKALKQWLDRVKVVAPTVADFDSWARIADGF